MAGGGLSLASATPSRRHLFTQPMIRREHPVTNSLGVNVEGKIAYIDKNVSVVKAGADTAARLAALGVAKR